MYLPRDIKSWQEREPDGQGAVYRSSTVVSDCLRSPTIAHRTHVHDGQTPAYMSLATPTGIGSWMANRADTTSDPCIAPTDGRCPIDGLPSEILAHIFSQGWTPERDVEMGKHNVEHFDDRAFNVGVPTWSSSADAKQPTVPGEPPFNILVSHVCARWRAVAVDSPLLWSHVRFTGSPPFRRAETYLERAKAAPIAITVDHVRGNVDWSGWRRSYDYDGALAGISTIMNLVVPHVAHWQAVKIVVTSDRHMHRVLEALGSAEPASILEILQLYYDDESNAYTLHTAELLKKSFRLFGGVAPRLTNVALWGVHVPWDLESAPYWAGLTNLELAYHAPDIRPSFYEFARILRASPDLGALTLCCSCPAGRPADWTSGMPIVSMEHRGGVHPAAVGPLVLSKLTDLQLTDLEPESLLALLPRLVLPALASLALHIDDYSDELLAYLASPHPHSLVQRVGVAAENPHTTRSLLANLTSLKITRMPASRACVRDAYRQMQALTALHLDAEELHSCWVELLFPQPADTRAGEEQVLLPRLQTLSTSGLVGARMRRLVQSREAQGVPLRAVLMKYPYNDAMTRMDEEWLVQHVERFEHIMGEDDEEDVGWSESEQDWGSESDIEVHDKLMDDWGYYEGEAEEYGWNY